METLEKMDMTHSSKQAWNMIKKLSVDPTEIKQPCAITANQVAHQLLSNGKTNHRSETSKIERHRKDEINLMRHPFTLIELQKGVRYRSSL